MRALFLACALLFGCTPSVVPVEREHAAPPRPAVVTTAQTSVPSSPTVVAAPPLPSMPKDPFTLEDDLHRSIAVYPPLEEKPHAPLLVLLHATCMQPAPICDTFGHAGRETGWLVCPSGNSTCYGEPDWYGTGEAKAAFLASALTKVEARVPTFLEEGNGVLIGWSRGAYAARDILYSENPAVMHRFRGLVLMAAAVTPDPAKLKKAGIHRVVMAAGDLDGSQPTMTAAVTKLKAAGLEARWVSFGKIPHVWPQDFEARMREPIAWAGQ